MATAIKDYSAVRVGQIWTPEDHAYLCHVLEEIDKTAMGMVRQAMREVREPDYELVQ